MRRLLIDLLVVSVGLVAILGVSRFGPSRSRTIVQASICFTTALVVFASSLPHTLFEDFGDSYYLAGRSVVDGSVPLPLIGANPDVDGFGFVNLPILAYLFAPFGLLTEGDAAIIFMLIGIGTTIAAWLLLTRLAGLEGNARWLLLFLIAANGPLLNSFREGNSIQMVLLMVVGGLHLLRVKRPFAAGCLLGVAALFKLPLLLFGAYFLLRRNWRAALGFASVCAASTLLSFAVFGWQIHVSWFENSVLQFSRHPASGWYLQSIPSFVIRFFEGTSEALFNFYNNDSPPLVQRVTTGGLISLAYLAALWACSRKSSSNDDTGETTEDGRDLEYLVVLCLAIVTSPLSWSLYYALLLMPFAFFLGTSLPIARELWWRRLAWVGIAFTTPAVLILGTSQPALAALYNRVGVSHFLFGGLIWFGLLVRERARLGTTAEVPSPAMARRSSPG